MTEEDRERVLAIERLRAGVGKKCLMSLMDEKIAALKPEDGRPKSCPRRDRLARLDACGRRWYSPNSHLKPD